MSVFLRNGQEQITQNYENHTGWAKGTDIVRQYNSVDDIITYDDGEVIKIMSNIPKNNHSLDCEGMGYGNYIMINYNNFVLLYAHLDDIFVKLGDKVKKGQVIAKMGNTGKSYGSHCHIEKRIYKNMIMNDLHNTNTFIWENPENLLNMEKSENIISTVYPEKGYKWYRVRKTWEDVKSQIGAYSVLNNALKIAEKNGYNVYDNEGNIIKR